MSLYSIYKWLSHYVEDPNRGRDFKEMQNKNNYRPDYDYYEDSLGDTYDDYDELYSKPVPDEKIVFIEDQDDYRDDDELEEPEEIDNPKDTMDDLSIGTGTSNEESRDDKEYQYSREDLIQLMDRYHNGDEEDKKYVRNQFCIMLTPLIRRTIRVTRGIDSEYLDYIQHCYLYVCKRLDRFDPNKSFAFKYFKYVIQEAITACHESSYGKSSHETNIDRKVRKQIREFSAMGITPSPSRIASETNLSVLQVEDSLFRIQAEKTVLGEDMSIYERNDGSNLPLDSILKNEVSETLANAINQLPKQEREAIMLSYNFYELDEEFSNKKIAEILHVSEIKVKELLISAKRHLKRDFSLDQLLGKSKRISHREYYYKESDPASFSFDSSSDAFLQLDAEIEPSDETGEIDDENTYYITRVRNIDFYKY